MGGALCPPFFLLRLVPALFSPSPCARPFILLRFVFHLFLAVVSTIPIPKITVYLSNKHIHLHKEKFRSTRN